MRPAHVFDPDQMGDFWHVITVTTTTAQSTQAAIAGSHTVRQTARVTGASTASAPRTLSMQAILSGALLAAALMGALRRAAPIRTTVILATLTRQATATLAVTTPTMTRRMAGTPIRTIAMINLTTPR